jgi:hypothetical protein
MKLPDPLTVDSLEAAYLGWSRTKEPNLELPISLPSPVPFCVEAPLLQFIASAARKSVEPLKVTFKGLDRASASYEDMRNLALGNMHALCAWLMSSTVEDEGGVQILKSESQAFTRYLDAMDAYEFLQTHGTAQTRANLVCVQGAQREFIQPLYHEVNGKKVVRPYPDIRLFVQDIVSQLAPQWSVKHLREVAEPLAQLVKELMENADWWARTDEKGELYPKGKGFRTLSFRLVDIDEDNAAVFGGSNHHLHHYLQTILLERGESDGGATSSRGRSMKRNTFMELIIVDSGPGLAKRWIASQDDGTNVPNDLDAIPMADEEQAVMKCFEKWATSSRSSSRGIGLFSVADMLREKNGFMRLRTGRLAYLFGTQSAIRDVQQGAKGLGVEGKTLVHRLEDGTTVFTEGDEIVFFLRPWTTDALAAIEGTSYSILLPV